jgi:hypothetical protein
MVLMSHSNPFVLQGLVAGFGPNLQQVIKKYRLLEIMGLEAISKTVGLRETSLSSDAGP